MLKYVLLLGHLTIIKNIIQDRLVSSVSHAFSLCKLWLLYTNVGDSEAVLYISHLLLYLVLPYPSL